MPQRAKIFTLRTFFFITCQTGEPFVAQVPANWMVAQWSMCHASVWRVLGPIPGKGIFCLSVPLYCCTDLHFFSVVLTCQVLRIKKPVPLLENDGTLDQQLGACRSMPQRAKIFLGTVGAWRRARGCVGGGTGVTAPPSCLAGKQMVQLFMDYKGKSGLLLPDSADDEAPKPRSPKKSGAAPAPAQSPDAASDSGPAGTPAADDEELSADSDQASDAEHGGAPAAEDPESPAPRAPDDDGEDAGTPPADAPGLDGGEGPGADGPAEAAAPPASESPEPAQDEAPLGEPSSEPSSEPSAEPSAEPAAEPVAEPTAESAAEPTEPPAESTAEPSETTAEPTAEPSEPTAEPTAEPAEGPPEPEPEPEHEPETNGDQEPHHSIAQDNGH